MQPMQAPGMYGGTPAMGMGRGGFQDCERGLSARASHSIVACWRSTRQGNNKLSLRLVKQQEGRVVPPGGSPLREGIEEGRGSGRGFVGKRRRPSPEGEDCTSARAPGGKRSAPPHKTTLCVVGSAHHRIFRGMA